MALRAKCSKFSNKVTTFSANIQIYHTNKSAFCRTRQNADVLFLFGELRSIGVEESFLGVEERRSIDDTLDYENRKVAIVGPSCGCP
jgi:hypothetical protein